MKLKFSSSLVYIDSKSISDKVNAFAKSLAKHHACNIVTRAQARKHAQDFFGMNYASADFVKNVAARVVSESLTKKALETSDTNERERLLWKSNESAHRSFFNCFALLTNEQQAEIKQAESFVYLTNSEALKMTRAELHAKQANVAKNESD